MKTVLVVGAGAAGLMAAGKAAEEGARVILFEKNKQPGKKILITGNGRCNLTNEANLHEFVKSFPGNGPFLYSAFSTFSNWDLISFFSERGLEVKLERGGRFFPVTDKAADVVAVLKKYCLEAGVEFRCGETVEEVIIRDSHVKGVKLAGGGEEPGNAVIIATGGMSYPSTGSTGDGYRMAEKAGHTIITPKPALVPLETREDWVKGLQGLTLQNVLVKVIAAGKPVGEESGEMLFTHFGVSGPVILTLSRTVRENLELGQEVVLKINLKPAFTQEQLDNVILRDFEKNRRKQLNNSLGELLSGSLIPVIIRLSNIPGDKPVHQISKRERLKLLALIQGLTITISRSRPLRDAMVTAGGVSVKEINPKTMESKLVQGLYFAGEVIDIDGYTGGFNLQAAFSTGYVAGKAAGQM